MKKSIFISIFSAMIFMLTGQMAFAQTAAPEGNFSMALPPNPAPAFNITSFFIPIVIIICVLAGLIAIGLFLRNYIKVPPNMVAIISGRKHRLPDGSIVGFRLVHGGATFRWPVLEKIDYLTLESMSIQTKTTGAITKEGVPLTVAAIANVKIGSDEISLRNASERFLGKEQREIEKIIADTLEAHLRGICCTLSVEAINQDRQAFAQKMISEAASDLTKMGVVIDVWAVQHVEDDQGYLTALGKKRTAEVKRDAQIGEAEALRDSEIKTAEAKRDATVKATNAQREGEVAKNKNLEAVAQATRDLQVKQAEMATEIATKEAIRDQAGPKAKAESEKAVFVAQVAAQEAKAEAETKLQEKLKERKKKELEATVIQQAEADRNKAEIDADAHKKSVSIRAEGDKAAAVTQAEAAKQVAVQEGEGQASKIRALADAEAQKIRAIKTAEAEGQAAILQKTGEAEGAAIRAKLLAEAEGTLKKAEALRQLEDAAKLMFILDRAPAIVEAIGEAAAKALGPAFQSVGAGLAAIDHVTIVETGGGSGQGGVAKFASVAPTAVFQMLQQARALGVDLQPMLAKLGVNVIEQLGVVTPPEKKE